MHDFKVAIINGPMFSIYNVLIEGRCVVSALLPYKEGMKEVITVCKERKITELSVVKADHTYKHIEVCEEWDIPLITDRYEFIRVLKTYLYEAGYVKPGSILSTSSDGTTWYRREDGEVIQEGC